MQIVPLQLSDVIYNAANQTFQACVIVHDTCGTRSYACAIDAPITMEFEGAAQGLAKQAMRRHVRGQSDSAQMPLIVMQRAGRPTRSRTRNTDRTTHGRPHAA